MKRMAVLTILLVIASPLNIMAFNDHRPVGRVLDTIPPRPPSDQQRDGNRHFHGHSDRSTASHASRHPAHPGDRSNHRPRPGRPMAIWPGSTTVVREIQPIIVLTQPSPQESPPAPEPEKIWVPPVMGTRTEPGYWDYGIRRVWMGDHWRYEQDVDQPIWVPEKQVEVVRQEGHWKIVE